MEIQSLGHVVLKVRDFEKSIPFYADILGLKEVARSGDRMVFFAFTGNHHDIALVQTGADSPEAPEKAPGLAHVAFKVGNTLDELRAAKTWLESQGVTIERMRDHDVSKSLYFRDPDGNRLEVFIDGDPKIWLEDPQRTASSAPLEL